MRPAERGSKDDASGNDRDSFPRTDRWRIYASAILHRVGVLYGLERQSMDGAIGRLHRRRYALHALASRFRSDGSTPSSDKVLPGNGDATPVPPTAVLPEPTEADCPGALLTPRSRYRRGGVLAGEARCRVACS